MEKKALIRNQKGFTLIEIIAVLVILGILAAVAVPKYIDLQSEAEEKAADAVFGAANSVVSLNFAKGILDSTNPGISTGQNILDLMDPKPDGWTAADNKLSKGTFVITIDTVEDVGKTRASISKSW